MNKKVISFSLWGNKAIYVLGAIVNADIAKKEAERRDIYYNELIKDYKSKQVT